MSTPPSSELSGGEPAATPETRAPQRKKRKWGFLSSGLVVILCAIVGELLGRKFLDSYWRAAKRGWQRDGDVGGFFSGLSDHVADNGGFGMREFVLLGFLISTSAFLWLQRAALKDFFRSMYTGSMLVILSIVGVTIGVLVPQIESFEDPDARITEANYEEEYNKFAWAEGYFLYHLLHLYGIGMPEEELSEQMASGLERFGARYGEEEASNREKRMKAALTGREKTEQIREFVYANEDSMRGAFDLFTKLDFNRAYKSYWFLTLMLLLFTAIAFNTFKGGWRNYLSVKKVGFFVVHMGMMTLLIGGGVSKAFTDRGILHLFADEGPKDVYWGHFDENKSRRMPFAVRLDHFARQDWKALEVHFLEEQFASNPPRYTLWQDKVIELDYGPSVDGGDEDVPRLRLEVVGLHNRAQIGETELAEGYDPENPQVRPYAELEVPDVHGYLPEGFHVGDPTTRRRMTPLLGADLMYDPGLDHRLRVAYETEDPSALFPSEDEEILGHLLVEVTGNAESLDPERLPIRLGETVTVTGGYQVSIVKASKNFQIAGDPPNQRPVPNTRPLPAQQPINPMVMVQILPPDGGERETRTLIEAIDPVEFGIQAKALYPDLVLRLRWDHWNSPGPKRHVLHWGRDVDPMLLSEDGNRQRVIVGQELDLPGEFPVIVGNLFNFAIVKEQNLAFLPKTEVDGWDKDFYSTDPRGLELRVIRNPGTSQESEQLVKLATAEQSTSEWVSDDVQIGLRFLENSEMLPFEWRSVLSIIERDGDGKAFTVDLGSEADREIRVNDYFTYGGYRFFQTNAHPDLPTYSGIGVVYDPGIPVVLLGMYTIIAGAVLTFFVRPIVLARRRA